MKKETRKFSLVLLSIIFVVLPLFFYITGDFSRRTNLKESISILTIIAFCLMLAQFFLMRRTNIGISGYRLGKVLIWHKIIGYVFVAILLIHPFLIVVPRYFEAGVDSMEAFITIITSFNSLGVVLGIISWVLMLILAVTSLFRYMLPLSYKAWRTFHGIMSTLFMIFASTHAINLGRHMEGFLSYYVVVLLTIGVLLLLKTYVVTSSCQRRHIRG